MGNAPSGESCATKESPAYQFLEEELQQKTAEHGRNHEAVADVCQRQGELLDAKGDHKDALDKFKEALDIRQQVFGEQHTAVAETLFCIACTLQHKCSHAKAVEIFQRAIAIQRTTNGPLSKEMGNSTNWMGYSQFRLGRYDYALATFGEALRIRRHQKDKEGIAETLFYVGRVHKKKGGKKEALDWYEQSMWAALEVGDARDAVRAIDKALPLRIELHGKSDLMVATMYMKQGALFDSEGKYQDAIKKFLAAQEIRQTRLGKRHPAVAEIWYILGSTLMHQEQFEKAIKCFGEALPVHRDKCGLRSKELGDSKNMIGYCQFKTGLLEDALTSFSYALRIRKLRGDKDGIAQTRGYIEAVRSAMKKKPTTTTVQEASSEQCATKDKETKSTTHEARSEEDSASDGHSEEDGHPEEDVPRAHAVPWDRFSPSEHKRRSFLRSEIRRSQSFDGSPRDNTSTRSLQLPGEESERSTMRGSHASVVSCDLSHNKRDSTRSQIDRRRNFENSTPDETSKRSFRLSLRENATKEKGAMSKMHQSFQLFRRKSTETKSTIHEAAARASIRRGSMGSRIGQTKSTSTIHEASPGPTKRGSTRSRVRRTRTFDSNRSRHETVSEMPELVSMEDTMRHGSSSENEKLATSLEGSKEMAVESQYEGISTTAADQATLPEPSQETTTKVSPGKKEQATLSPEAIFEWVQQGSLSAQGEQATMLEARNTESSQQESIPAKKERAPVQETNEETTATLPTSGEEETIGIALLPGASREKATNESTLPDSNEEKAMKQPTIPEARDGTAVKQPRRPEDCEQTTATKQVASLEASYGPTINQGALLEATKEASLPEVTIGATIQQATISKAIEDKTSKQAPLEETDEETSTKQAAKVSQEATTQQATRLDAIVLAHAVPETSEKAGKEKGSKPEVREGKTTELTIGVDRMQNFQRLMSDWKEITTKQRTMSDSSEEESDKQSTKPQAGEATDKDSPETQNKLSLSEGVKGLSYERQNKAVPQKSLMGMHDNDAVIAPAATDSPTGHEQTIDQVEVHAGTVAVQAEPEVASRFWRSSAEGASTDGSNEGNVRDTKVSSDHSKAVEDGEQGPLSNEDDVETTSQTDSTDDADSIADENAEYVEEGQERSLPSDTPVVSATSSNLDADFSPENNTTSARKNQDRKRSFPSDAPESSTISTNVGADSSPQKKVTSVEEDQARGSLGNPEDSEISGHLEDVDLSDEENVTFAGENQEKKGSLVGDGSVENNMQDQATGENQEEVLSLNESLINCQPVDKGSTSSWFLGKVVPPNAVTTEPSKKEASDETTMQQAPLPETTKVSAFTRFLRRTLSLDSRASENSASVEEAPELVAPSDLLEVSATHCNLDMDSSPEEKATSVEEAQARSVSSDIPGVLALSSNRDLNLSPEDNTASFKEDHDSGAPSYVPGVPAISSHPDTDSSPVEDLTSLERVQERNAPFDASEASAMSSNLGVDVSPKVNVTFDKEDQEKSVLSSVPKVSAISGNFDMDLRPEQKATSGKEDQERMASPGVDCSVDNNLEDQAIGKRQGSQDKSLPGNESSGDCQPVDKGSTSPWFLGKVVPPNEVTTQPSEPIASEETTTKKESMPEATKVSAFTRLLRRTLSRDSSPAQYVASVEEAPELVVPSVVPEVSATSSHLDMNLSPGENTTSCSIHDMGSCPEENGAAVEENQERSEPSRAPDVSAISSIYDMDSFPGENAMAVEEDQERRPENSAPSNNIGIDLSHEEITAALEEVQETTFHSDAPEISGRSLDPNSSPKAKAASAEDAQETLAPSHAPEVSARSNNLGVDLSHKESATSDEEGDEKRAPTFMPEVSVMSSNSDMESCHEKFATSVEEDRERSRPSQMPVVSVTSCILDMDLSHEEITVAVEEAQERNVHPGVPAVSATSTNRDPDFSPMENATSVKEYQDKSAPSDMPEASAMASKNDNDLSPEEEGASAKEHQEKKASPEGDGTVDNNLEDQAIREKQDERLPSNESSMDCQPVDKGSRSSWFPGMTQARLSETTKVAALAGYLRRSLSRSSDPEATFVEEDQQTSQPSQSPEVSTISSKHVMNSCAEEIAEAVEESQETNLNSEVTEVVATSSNLGTSLSPEDIVVSVKEEQEGRVSPWGDGRDDINLGDKPTDEKQGDEDMPREEALIVRQPMEKGQFSGAVVPPNGITKQPTIPNASDETTMKEAQLPEATKVETSVRTTKGTTAKTATLLEASKVSTTKQPSAHEDIEDATTKQSLLYEATEEASTANDTVEASNEATRKEIAKPKASKAKEETSMKKAVEASEQTTLKQASRPDSSKPTLTDNGILLREEAAAPSEDPLPVRQNFHLEMNEIRAKYESQIKKLEEENKDLKEEKDVYSKMKEFRAKYEAQIKELEEDNKTLKEEKDIYLKMKEIRAKCEALIKELEEENKVLKEEKKVLKSLKVLEAQRLEADLESQRQAAAAAEIRAVSAESHANALQKQYNTQAADVQQQRNLLGAATAAASTAAAAEAVKIKKLNEEMAQKNKEIEQKVKELEDASKELAEAKEDAENQRIAFVKERENLAQKNSNFMVTVAGMEEELLATRNQLENIEKAKMSLEEGLEQAELKGKQDMEIRKGLEAGLAESQSRNDLLQHQVENLKTWRNAAQEEKKLLKEEVSSKTTSAAQLETQVQDMSKQMKILENVKSALHNELGQLKERSSQDQDKMMCLEKVLAETKALAEERENLAQKNSNFMVTVAGMEEELLATRNQLENIEKAKMSLEEGLEQAELKGRQDMEIRKGLEAGLAESQSRNDLLEHQVKDLKTWRNAAQEEKKLLTEEVSSKTACAAQLETLVQDMSKQIGILENVKSTLHNELGQLKERSSQDQDKMMSSEKALAETKVLAEERGKLLQENSNLKETVVGMEEELLATRNQLEKVEKAKMSLEEGLEQAELNAKVLKEENGVIFEMNNIRVKCEALMKELEDENKVLKEENKVLKDPTVAGGAGTAVGAQAAEIQELKMQVDEYKAKLKELQGERNDVPVFIALEAAGPDGTSSAEEGNLKRSILNEEAAAPGAKPIADNTVSKKGIKGVTAAPASNKKAPSRIRRQSISRSNSMPSFCQSLDGDALQRGVKGAAGAPANKKAPSRVRRKRISRSTTMPNHYESLDGDALKEAISKDILALWDKQGLYQDMPEVRDEILKEIIQQKFDQQQAKRVTNGEKEAAVAVAATAPANNKAPPTIQRQRISDVGTGRLPMSRIVMGTDNKVGPKMEEIDAGSGATSRDMPQPPNSTKERQDQHRHERNLQNSEETVNESQKKEIKEVEEETRSAVLDGDHALKEAIAQDILAMWDKQGLYQGMPEVRDEILEGIVQEILDQQQGQQGGEIEC